MSIIIPSLEYREALAYGNAVIKGVLGPGSPASRLKSMLTPGPIDLNSLFDFNHSHQNNGGRNDHPQPAEDKASKAIKKTQPAAKPTPTHAPGGTWTLPTASAKHATAVTDAEFKEAGEQIGVSDVAIIKSVAQVESGGQGFMKDGRPIVRYEPHHFRTLSGKRFDKSDPDLSAPYSEVKARHLSKGNKAGYLALEQAMKLDSDAAVEACSWGAFQVMGDCWKDAGFASPQDMVIQVYQSLGAHLKLFVGFVKKNKLANTLKGKEWTAFARRYNGPNYAVNNYDTKLADNYQKFSGGA